MAAEAGTRPGARSWVDGTAPAMQERVLQAPPLAFVEYCLRGVGQVMFMNNPFTGLFVLAAAWLFDPWLGFGGTLGVVVSNLVAVMLRFDRGAIHAGLFGFNGVLCGLALATFLAPKWDGVAVTWIIVVSAGSSVAMAALAALFAKAWGVPPFTLAFNLSVLLFMIASLHTVRGRLGESISPLTPAVDGPLVSTALREHATAAVASSLDGWINAVFRGIGQLFFVNSILGGVLVLIGIAICSRIAAGFALIGVVIGTAVGIGLGASGVAIYNGLWGFNSYDACLAIAGVFYVLTWRSALLGMACAAYTALLFGAIASFLGPWGLPAMTLPFCFGVLTFVMLRGTTPLFTPIEAADITTPEEHLARAQAQAKEEASASG